MAKKNHYDLIIIGAGPAGMTAGIYAARKLVDTLVVTGDIGGQTAWSSGIENYLGFIFIPGVDLVQKFEEHLRKFGVEIEFNRISKLKQANELFELDMEDGRVFTARSVIAATGKSSRMLNVPGEKDFIGKGVAYCATCDAPLFSGMNVAVIGGGNSGLDAVVELMKICPKVYLIEIGDELRADEVMQDRARNAGNVEILLRTVVKEIRGDMFVSQIVIEDRDSQKSRVLDVKGVFVEIGLVPNSDFVKDLVMLNRRGEIPVDCAAHTDVPGLFAAGDVTNVPEKQIIVAAGDGAKAALGAYSYLVRQPVPSDWARR